MPRSARCSRAPSGSRLVFTYVRRDFIDGVNMYGAADAVQAIPATAAGVEIRPRPRRRRGVRRRVRLAARRASRTGLLSCATTFGPPAATSPLRDLEWSAYCRSSPSPRRSSLDLDDRRHDHRLAAVGLPHPLADRAAHRLRDPGDIGDVVGGKGFQLLLDLARDGLERLGILGEAAGMQVRRRGRFARCRGARRR